MTLPRHPGRAGFSAFPTGLIPPPGAGGDSFKGMHSPASRLRSALIVLALTLPLIAGVIVAAAVSLTPASAWSAGDDTTGAPVADAPGGIDPAELVDARRATGEAASQAGFLLTGTGELVAGTGELREGAEVLPQQLDEAVTGSRELANGMIELQAGTGQLGAGATEVADGVEAAVAQVIGLGAVQGQILGILDETMRELDERDEPETETSREELANLRTEVENFDFDAAVVADLAALRDGSREVANQLNVPGYGFHDGIYTATAGAQELADGLAQARGGVDDAIAGVTALDDGAQRIEQMSEQNQERINTIQRALPAVQATTDDLAADAPRHLLSPLYAMFIAALAMLGGVALGVATHFLPTRRNQALLAGVLALTVLGTVLTAIVARGFTGAAAGLSALVLALGVLAAVALTRVGLRLFGPVAGSVVAAGLGLLQVGVVGWVWQAAAAADVAAFWQAIAGLMPLNWATVALTVLGNDGSATALWLGVAVLAVLAAAGAGILRATRPTEAPDNADDTEAEVVGPA